MVFSTVISLARGAGFYVARSVAASGTGLCAARTVAAFVARGRHLTTKTEIPESADETGKGLGRFRIKFCRPYMEEQEFILKVALPPTGQDLQNYLKFLDENKIVEKIREVMAEEENKPVEDKKSGGT